jgi:hypothetical protein
LEALCGHVVVGEEPGADQDWNAPESFTSWVCVPVADDRLIHGTLWAAWPAPGTIDHARTGLVELAAGRLALELARADEPQARRSPNKGRRARGLRTWLKSRLPQVTSPLAGWQLAGGMRYAAGGPAGFYDWFFARDGRAVLTLGELAGRGEASRLSAAQLWGTVRGLGAHRRGAAGALSRINRTIYQATPGDVAANVFLGQVDEQLGTLSFASAGDPAVLHVTGDQFHSLAQPDLPLGSGPRGHYELKNVNVGAGDVVLIAGAACRDVLDERGRLLGDQGLAETIVQHRRESAEGLVRRVRDRIDRHAGSLASQSQIVLVARRVGQ